MKRNFLFEILSYNNELERKKWLDIYNSFSHIDIFYHPDYVSLFELHGEGDAHLFVYYSNKDSLVINPFLKRSLRSISYFRNITLDLYDITSPYGYAGYLCNHNNIDMDGFYECYNNYCKNNNIVSEFIRFHPILENVQYASGAIDVKRYNQTVVIDLTKSNDEIFNKFTPTCRNKIRKALKNEVNISIDNNFQYLDIFITNYYKTMARLNAIEYYYFNINWFNNLINRLKGKVFLFHATTQDIIISSSLFIAQYPFIHYFLTGASFENRNLAANNLLLYEVARWAKEKGFKNFHLGGGTLPQDSLFLFKASFSPIRKDFFLGKVIHQPEYYDYLCKVRFGEEMPDIGIDYFPLYRIPEQFLRECKRFPGIIL